MLLKKSLRINIRDPNDVTVLQSMANLRDYK